MLQVIFKHTPPRIQDLVIYNQGIYSFFSQKTWWAYIYPRCRCFQLIWNRWERGSRKVSYLLESMFIDRTVENGHGFRVAPTRKWDCRINSASCQCVCSLSKIKLEKDGFLSLVILSLFSIFHPSVLIHFSLMHWVNSWRIQKPVSRSRFACVEWHVPNSWRKWSIGCPQGENGCGGRWWWKVVCAEQSSSYTRDGRIKSFSKIPLPSFRHGKRSIKAVGMQACRDVIVIWLYI